MAKKIVIIVGSIIAIAVIGFCGYLYSLKVRIDRGDLVKWNNQWYTKEALEQIIPPQVYEVESKNTPEEVYAKFREALLKDDIDGALSYFRLEKREVYKESLLKYKNVNLNLTNLGGSYPLVIEKERDDGNFSYYSYKFIKDGKTVDSRIDFVKNSSGIWEIDDI